MVSTTSFFRYVKDNISYSENLRNKNFSRCLTGKHKECSYSSWGGGDLEVNVVYRLPLYGQRKIIEIQQK